MSSPLPPFPPSGSFLKSIRTSSRTLRQANNITIEHEAIKRLLFSPAFTSSYKRVSASHGLAFPLKFPSILSELNLLSVLSLLNIGSGYRIPLRVETGRGAWDTIRALVFSMYITSASGDDGDLLSAKGMQAIRDQQIAELMGVKVHVERAHETIPGVVIGELGGPLYELVKLITEILNETGKTLLQSGYPDLGSFVLEALKKGGSVKKDDADQTATLEFVLEQLVRAIPAFRDMAVVDGHAIYCFKKALFLINGISVRFGSIAPPPFAIPDTKNSPVFTDNVLPSILIHLGVIDLSGSLTLSSFFPDAGSPGKLDPLLAEAAASQISKSDDAGAPKEGPILTPDQAYVLRAAAIDACELIVEVARSLEASAFEGREHLIWIKDIVLPDLDDWLWAVAKDRLDYRNLERFVSRGSMFF